MTDIDQISSQNNILIKAKILTDFAILKNRKLTDLSIMACLTIVMWHFKELPKETKAGVVEELLYAIFIQNNWTTADDIKDDLILDQFTDYCKITKRIIDNHLTKDGQLIVSMRLEILLRNELTNLAIKRIFSIF